ncbi:MAG: leucine-rich repeat domain-containing protein [Clostridia bacterium]|nr:leucine-rich repeat domain-containing protein [Clostridia bacterium]
MKKKVLLTVLSAIFVVAGCLGLSSCKKDLQALDTPSNIKMENRVLTWDAVENASEYILLINGKEYTVTEPRLELYTIAKEGEFHLKLMAGGDGKTYEDSSWATSAFTLEAPIEHGFDKEGFEYTFLEDGSGYEVAKGTANLEGFVSIPDYFDGYPVVRIAHHGFTLGNPDDQIATSILLDQDCNYITTGIKLPAFLRSIENTAFVAIVYLTEIVLPTTVNKLGQRSFADNMNLKRIVIPEGVKEIPLACFENTGLEEIILPEGLERIDRLAFQCKTVSYGPRYHISSNLTEIVIPDSVTHIERSAFQGRENLTKITMSKNIEFIGEETFADTAWLAAQNGLVYFNDSILYTYAGNMPEHTELVLPDKTTQICNYAFKGQKNLEKVVIPDGVQLGNESFKSCTALKEVQLPSDLTLIPHGAFANTGIESITIPSSVKVIAPSAFFSCRSLKEVILNEGLECIGHNAFKSCENLTTVHFPSTLKVIAKYAFTFCDALTEVTFENEEGWADYVVVTENSVRTLSPIDGDATPVDNIPALTASTAPNWICGNPDDAMEYIGYLV